MATDLMPTEVFLEQYHLTTGGGKPVQIGRNGPAITYRASDQKTGAPVALTIVPIDAVDPAEREHFEEKARTAMLLDHINIAKTIEFGTNDDSFVFVSEFPPGETVEAWVKANGPMPPDAVLRVALQVVAALGAASFHGLSHPAIQPGNLVIVRGKTAEGGWPFVKLTHFALSGLRSAPHHVEPDLGASDFASPEQLLQGKVDFRSEIYSLGATMCFLLTGVFYSAYPRSPQTKRFARPLRTLVARTLEDDPAERPQDPVLFTEELRTCMAAIERRQDLRRRFGIPFSPLVARAPRKQRIRQTKPTPLLAPIGPARTSAARVSEEEPAELVRPGPSRWRPALAVAGGLFALGLIAALFLPEDVVMAAFHRKKTKPIETIGVPVGVPDNSPAMAAQNNPSPSMSSPPKSQVIAAAPSPSTNAINKASPATEVARNEAAPPPAPANEAAGSVNRRDLAHSAPPVPAVGSEQNIVAANEPPSAAPQLQSNHDAQPATPPTTIASKASPSGAGEAETAAPQMDHGLSTAPSATSAEVVANDRKNEPAPPAESADQNAASQSNSGANATENTERAPEVANSSVENESKSKAPESSDSTTTAKSRIKKSPAIAQHRNPVPERVPRALPAEPDQGPRSGRGPGGTMRARVVGVTPAGNVILELPSGERAIVSPEDAEAYSGTKVHRHRPRRVIIERRVVAPPPYQQYPPYQPFLPPED